MEQQGTSTSTLTNVQIPGVPSDASALNSIRSIFRRNDSQKRPKSVSKAQKTEGRGTVDVPTHVAIVCEPGQAREDGNVSTDNAVQCSAETPSKHANTKKSASADVQSKSPTIERQANVAPAELSVTQVKATTQQSLSTPNGILTHPVPDLITKNDTIRRILEGVNWTKLRGDTVVEVATFQKLEDAETKFQEFESFIRAEGKHLDLPEGCKPFERVLIQGSKAGSKPDPYIRFTNFRTEEDVRKYHAALSKRKVKHQYHPPLRLCYEIQRLKFHAANSGIPAEGDPSETLCGKTAVIEDGGTRRLVTIGGVIQVDNKLYAMTAGHSGAAADELQNTSETESYLSPSSDYVEYDDDIESALICGGPSTDSDPGWQPHRDRHNDQNHNPPESAALTFYGSSMSGDDWSLHLIEDPLLALPNALPAIHDFTTRYMTYPARQPLPGPVLLIAGVSGPLLVHMLSGIVSFPLPSGNWVSAWKIALTHRPVPAYPSHHSLALQRGDSGSWVVDRINGNVFGHVIASTDTTAFLIPLIHTLDSISHQAKLKSTGKIISLPPAFDMLADLAHVYYNRPGERSQDQAKLFASRALMSSTKIQSPASEVAPFIDSVLNSHQNTAAIWTIVQNLLVRTGANLKGNLESIYRNENSEILAKVIEDSAPIEKELTTAAILNLTSALWNYSEIFDIHETPWGRRLLLPGGERLESEGQSNHNEPGSQSSTVLTMSGALQHSTNDVVKWSNRLFEPISEVGTLWTTLGGTTLGSTKLEKHEKHNPVLGEARDPPSSARYDTLDPTEPRSPPPAPAHHPKSRMRRLCRVPPWACAGLSSLFIALIAVIGVLGGLLGAEVQQNKILRAQLAKVNDTVPSCQTTVIVSAFSATGTASTTAATSTATDTTSSSGLSTGAKAGIGIAVTFGILSIIPLLYWCAGGRRKVRK